MVVGEIGVMPYFDLTLFVESDVVVADGEWSHSFVEVLETCERFRECVESLSVIEISDVAQSVGDVFRVNADILLIAADTAGAFVFGVIDLNKGFVGGGSMCVDVHFVGL